MVRGGPLEITGGGVKIPKKKFLQRKIAKKKKKKKKFLQAARPSKKVPASKLNQSIKRSAVEKQIVQSFHVEKKIHADNLH